MSWILEGSAKKRLILGVTNSGKRTISGDAETHKPDFYNNYDSEFHSRLLNSSCSWSIYPSDEIEVNIDGSATGLFDKVKCFPENSHASITFYESPDLVGIDIVFPPSIFSEVYKLFQLVLTDENIGYSINIYFGGFRSPDVNTDTPTLDEFQHSGELAGGKIYLSEEIDISIGRAFKTT